MDKNLIKSRDRVLAFMESIELSRKEAHENEMFNNSYKMKMLKLKEEKEKCRRYCIGNILASIYKNALPIGNDYKVIYGDELKDDMVNFITNNPMKKNYYITDNYKKSPVMIMLNNKIQTLTEKKFEDIENNIDDVTTSEIKFEPDHNLDDSLQKITDDIGVDDVTNIIASNVQRVAKDEIERAKKEKETRADIEKQLASDLSITTQEAVDNYLELHDLNTKRDFKPSLFQGIMIGKTKKLQEMYESGSYTGKFIFDALESYSSNPVEKRLSSPMESAFLESVKDFTKLSILKTLKLETMNFYDTGDLALEYAQN